VNISTCLLQHAGGSCGAGTYKLKSPRFTGCGGATLVPRPAIDKLDEREVWYHAPGAISHSLKHCVLNLGQTACLNFAQEYSLTN